MRKKPWFSSARATECNPLVDEKANSQVDIATELKYLLQTVYLQCFIQALLFGVMASRAGIHISPVRLAPMQLKIQ
jgi:hypothetical protein